MFCQSTNLPKNLKKPNILMKSTHAISRQCYVVSTKEIILSGQEKHSSVPHLPTKASWSTGIQKIEVDNDSFFWIGFRDMNESVPPYAT